MTNVGLFSVVRICFSIICIVNNNKKNCIKVRFYVIYNTGSKTVRLKIKKVVQLFRLVRLLEHHGLVT